jgi:Transposase domain (DUF772)/Transposase DDE domain
VTLGRQLRRPDLPATGARWCEAALPAGSVYRFLARERGRLFPPELFVDLFESTGRRSVPPSILAVVMVLQRLEGLSDREAADRFAFDMRWRYAAGVADAVAGEETASFAHTVLVDLRARLRRSQDQDRIFRVTCELAREVGLVGVRRVLDSAPLEDAVTTQDTVTLLRGAIRGLLRVCPPPLAAKVRAGLRRDDDYRAPGKPACDWEDRAAREQLVDALVRDAYRAHFALRGERLDPRVAEAAALLATVTGQAIEETDDGRFRIFEGTAPDRVISTVDPEARHGHKTAAHGFDGYKAHVATDPDSEVICAAEVSPAATGDAVVAPTLLGDVASDEDASGQTARAVVYGDSAYGTGAHLAWLEQQGLTPMVKTAFPTAPGGRFAKDQFRIDLAAGTVTCPARVTVAITPSRRGGGRARFGIACSVCPLRPACTGAVAGRVVAILPTRPPSPPPGPASVTPPGGPTTEPPDPRSNASSPTCYAAATAAAAPGSEGWCAWPRTSSSWPGRSTWPASPPSACAGRRPAGRCSPPDGGSPPTRLPGTALNAQNSYNLSENTAHLAGASACWPGVVQGCWIGTGWPEAADSYRPRTTASVARASRVPTRTGRPVLIASTKSANWATWAAPRPRWPAVRVSASASVTWLVSVVGAGMDSSGASPGLRWK